MDFSALFATQPTEPFVTMGIWLTLFSAVLLAAMVLMIFLRLRPLRKEYRDQLNSIVSGMFLFACLGYFLVIFRLSHVSFLSMRALYIVWFAGLLVYMFRKYTSMQGVMRLVQRKVANNEKKAAEAKVIDPYLAAAQKGKKKRK